MMSDPLFTKLLLVVLIWLCVTLHLVWPSEPPAARATQHQPTTPPRKRPDDRETGQDWCACDPLNRAERGPENRFKSS